MLHATLCLSTLLKVLNNMWKTDYIRNKHKQSGDKIACEKLNYSGDKHINDKTHSTWKTHTTFEINAS